MKEYKTTEKHREYSRKRYHNVIKKDPKLLALWRAKRKAYYLKHKNTPEYKAQKSKHKKTYRAKHKKALQKYFAKWQKLNRAKRNAYSRKRYYEKKGLQK